MYCTTDITDRRKKKRAVKSFYEGSRACVKFRRGESDWLEVNVGLRHGCVM